jgi:hypothetical protein
MKRQTIYEGYSFADAARAIMMKVYNVSSMEELGRKHGVWEKGTPEYEAQKKQERQQKLASKKRPKRDR